ncbi:MAG: phosphoenolpyruvate carboxylase [Planctomycetota bacterium]|jgi:phosphoenolpyruvate carboxylase|nr:phosphoenolpyruvate carboxylase [Planctomycetota bacterium]
MTDLLHRALAHTDAMLNLLTDSFRQVLLAVEPDGADLAAVIPDPEKGAPASRHPRSAEVLAVWFQLLNLAEEHASTTARRARIEQAASPWRDSWAALLRTVGDDDEAVLQRVSIEPVLTAHPTEAKPPQLRALHRELSRYLHHINPAEKPSPRVQAELQEILERLWRCGQTASSKPSVADELEDICQFLEQVFPDAVTELDQRFVAAWRAGGGDASLIDDPKRWPSWKFGTWVGGDRDGHGGVTAAVTHRALRRLRLGALHLQRQSLAHLSNTLVLNASSNHASDELRAELRRQSVLQGLEIDTAGTDQPWHDLCRLLVRRIDAEIQALEAGGDGTLRSHDLRQPLAVCSASLRAIRANAVEQRHLRPALRRLEVFGLHLARLDVRQNSTFHDQAIDEIIRTQGGDIAWMQLDPEQRFAFLDAALRNPASTRSETTGAAATTVFDCYQVLARHRRHHGDRGLGSLIVSMTRHPSDLLAVHYLALQAGFADYRNGRWLAPMPVVPLLETRGDLEAGTGILGRYRDWLAEAAGTEPQQVMVGYSDSNKDAGYFAGQWAVHRAQSQLVRELGGDSLHVFHGRGGTVSRGAGPIHRFLEALPPGAAATGIRVTEQGEVLAQKYANLPTAVDHLEQLQTGAFNVARHALTTPADPSSKHALFAAIAEGSETAYRELLSHPGFERYWAQATPVDLLEHASIGSRPVRRTGRRSLADLRAIPWVFGWGQSRHYLTGWYGFGTAVMNLNETDRAALQQLAASSEAFLHYSVRNIQLSLASSDLDIAKCYAQLVDDVSARDAVFQLIADEFARTDQALHLIAGGDWRAQRPRAERTIALRATALTALHHQQIELLAAWRQGSNEVLPQLLQTVAAIGSGSRAMG